jgi:hypothetical protein
MLAWFRHVRAGEDHDDDAAFIPKRWMDAAPRAPLFEAFCLRHYINRKWTTDETINDYAGEADTVVDIVVHRRPSAVRRFAFN